jgi:hypothetical protein
MKKKRLANRMRMERKKKRQVRQTDFYLMGSKGVK